jgi:hypothetical protein
VKKVTVYGAFEAFTTISQPYYDWANLSLYGKMDSHTVSGEYWNEANFGVTTTNAIINAPSQSVDSTRSKGLQKDFLGNGNFDFTDTAVFSKIFEVNDPTEEIRFDLNSFDITRADPSERFAGFGWTGTYYPDGTGGHVEGLSKTYNIGYNIENMRILIVVDWSFKHLGRGFEPQTNSPAWR